MGDSYDNRGLTGRSWFKPAVAVWFALLLGGGLWLMPPGVHQRLAGMLGLGVMLEGVLILCAGFALLGLLLGWVVAARIAAASAPRGFAPGFEFHSDDGWDEAPAEDDPPRRRRVFSAREDIGEEGIAISAPMDEDERVYEEEFSIEDGLEASPEDDFAAVYAGMQPDYVPAEEVEHDAGDFDEPVEDDIDYAEFEEAEYVPLEPEIVEAKPAAESDTYAEPREEAAQADTPFGDMSLDALLGRLEGAMAAHKDMVAASERAASEPAPRTVPMTRSADPDEDEPQPLADVADDDPVIAFLRREASRRMPQHAANEDADPVQGEAAHERRPSTEQTDAQAALRSALDRLGNVSRKD